MIEQIPSKTLPELYYGSLLDIQSCEIVMIDKVPASLLKYESQLFEKKWFDYRPLHPVTATYLMTHQYNLAFGDFLNKTADRERRFTHAIKGKDVMKHKEVLSFWRLRQLIDDLGMRYEFFLRAAMNWHLHVGWGKAVSQPPRPCHMLNNDDMILDISNAWSKECKAKIQYATTRHFTTTEYRAAKHQTAYEQYVVDQIKKRPNPVYALHSAMYLFDALRLETAMQNFTAEQILAASQYCLDQISH